MQKRTKNKRQARRPRPQRDVRPPARGRPDRLLLRAHLRLAGASGEDGVLAARAGPDGVLATHGRVVDEVRDLDVVVGPETALVVGAEAPTVGLAGLGDGDAVVGATAREDGLRDICAAG